LSSLQIFFGTPTAEGKLMKFNHLKSFVLLAGLSVTMTSCLDYRLVEVIAGCTQTCTQFFEDSNGRSNPPSWMTDGAQRQMKRACNNQAIVPADDVVIDKTPPVYVEIDPSVVFNGVDRAGNSDSPTCSGGECIDALLALRDSCGDPNVSNDQQACEQDVDQLIEDVGPPVCVADKATALR
jgi:hypothetical protein